MLGKLGGLKGIFSPLVVPYNNDSTVNYDEYTRLAKYVSDNGVNGVLVGGSTGEFANLTIEERKNLLTAALEGVGKDCSVIYNCTALNKQDVETYISWGKKHSVDGFTSTTPYYHEYDDTAMYRYFKMISDLCEETPFYLYNIPGRTHNPISINLLKNLLDTCDHIKGIKDSSMNFATFQEYQLAAKGRDFDVSTGNDMQVLPALDYGGAGAVIALSTIFPKSAAEIYRLFQKGEKEKAHEIQTKFIEICGTIRNIMPIMAHKKLIEFAGFNPGNARTPMRDLTTAESEQLKTNVLALGLLPNNI